MNFMDWVCATDIADEEIRVEKAKKKRYAKKKAMVSASDRNSYQKMVDRLNAIDRRVDHR